MKKTLLGAVSAVALLGAASLALAQTPPQVSAIGPTDLFQDVVGGYGQVQSWFVNALTLANYAATQPGNNPENAIVGGDFSTNLFQDGTSVGSVAGTITYVADQWAAWGGTTTVITGTQQADAPAGYLDSLRINKASGTGGTVPACVVQEIPSANSYRFQGQTAEFDFHAKAGAGFSSATSALAVSIVYGTGTDVDRPDQRGQQPRGADHDGMAALYRGGADPRDRDRNRSRDLLHPGRQRRLDRLVRVHRRAVGAEYRADQRGRHGRRGAAGQ
jgi:hypothetical protein